MRTPTLLNRLRVDYAGLFDASKLMPITSILYVYIQSTINQSFMQLDFIISYVLPNSHDRTICLIMNYHSTINMIYIFGFKMSGSAGLTGQEKKTEG